MPDRPIQPDSEESAPIAEIVEELSAGISSALDEADAAKRERALGWILGKLQEHSASLKQGLQSFAELRAEAAAIRKEMTPKKASPLPLIALAVTVVLALAGFVWTAARYPDRAEFNAKTQTMETTVQTLTLQGTLTQRDVSELREALKRDEAQIQAQQSKLDQLLLHQGRP